MRRSRAGQTFLAAAVFQAAVTVLPLPAQNYDEIQSERVASGLSHVDGIVWSRDGFLVFADPLKKKIYRLDPGKAPDPTDEDHNGAQGLAYDVQSRLYICENDTRRVARLDRKGKMETLAETYQGKKFNSPNDIVVRRDGHAYFTDPAFAGAIDHRELDFNGIFHIGPKGELDLVAKWQTRPNGIAISNDGKTLFVTDSDRHAVVAFDVDGKGAVTNQRDVIRNIHGVPGGLRVDAAGKLYVAAWGLGVYAPDGKLIHTLLPGEITTNCAWGEPDFQTLFVAGRKAVYRVRLGVKGSVQY